MVKRYHDTDPDYQLSTWFLLPTSHMLLAIFVAMFTCTEETDLSQGTNDWRGAITHVITGGQGTPKPTQCYQVIESHRYFSGCQRHLEPPTSGAISPVLRQRRPRYWCRKWSQCQRLTQGKAGVSKNRLVSFVHNGMTGTNKLYWWLKTLPSHLSDELNVKKITLYWIFILLQVLLIRRHVSTTTLSSQR